MKPSRIDILFDLILQVFPRKTIKLNINGMKMNIKSNLKKIIGKELAA